MLSTEQLLQPRYLCTSPTDSHYPYSPFKVGGIIELNQISGSGSNCCTINGVVYSDTALNKYPHLFRRLKWWEFRGEKDMPEYVKLNPENCIIEEVEKGEVFKVWSIKIFDDGIGLKIYPPAEKDPANPMMEYMHLKYLLPATAEEYEQFTHPAPLGDKQ